mmetsp:Transcript_14846/g.51342  ORF Transcript_14846/g.51342 Transcript_14846/m.51342 type:complete len:215 (+) Transcript_14846:1566-2210(+)
MPSSDAGSACCSNSSSSFAPRRGSKGSPVSPSRRHRFRMRRRCWLPVSLAARARMPKRGRPRVFGPSPPPSFRAKDATSEFVARIAARCWASRCMRIVRSRRWSIFAAFHSGANGFATTFVFGVGGASSSPEPQPPEPSSKSMWSAVKKAAVPSSRKSSSSSGFTVPPWSVSSAVTSQSISSSVTPWAPSFGRRRSRRVILMNSSASMPFMSWS